MNYSKQAILFAIIMHVFSVYTMVINPISLKNITQYQSLQMVTVGQNIFILAQSDVKLSHYRLSSTSIKHVETHELNSVNWSNYRLKTAYPKFFNNLVSDGSDAIALADTSNTIYYIKINAESAKLDFNTAPIESAHNTPILNLFMDKNFIVSGSEYPTIKMWDIKRDDKNNISLNKVFEQSHAYLFYYDNGSLFYGDWRWQNRTSHWFPWTKQTNRILNLVCKENFSEKNNKFLDKYEFGKKNYGSSKSDEIIETYTLLAPFNLPICTGSQDWFAIQDAENSITAYKKEAQYFKESISFAGTKNEPIQDLYINKNFLEKLIFVTNAKIKYGNLVQPSIVVGKQNNLKLQEIQDSLITASAIGGQEKNILFLITFNQETNLFKLHAIDLNQYIEKKISEKLPEEPKEEQLTKLSLPEQSRQDISKKNYL